MKAWHFIKDDKTMKYGNGEIIKVGEKYSVEGHIKLCKFGLHGSIDPRDALQYAPGSIICWCEYGGKIILGDDKLVAQERTVLWMASAEEVIRGYGRWCALEVIENWNAPEIVIEYLNTGNVEIRHAAWSAARYATESAAEYAAKYAAEYAARYAAKYAAWSAAEYAAESKQNKKLTEMLNSLQGEISC